MVDICGRSFVGASKDVNQDAYCFLTAETPFGDATFVAVCDGVGGLSAGEEASSYAVWELSHWFEESFPVYVASNQRDGVVDLANLKGAWTVLLERLNAGIRDHGLRENLRLGSTVTVLLVLDARFAIAHVGDCRAYRLRGGAFEQLTRDQTLIQQEVDAGRISAEAALTHPKGSVILQALGAQDEIEPEFFFGESRDGDTFLVACDGFYRRLGIDGLVNKVMHATAMDEGFLDGLLSDAIAQVVDKGEKDNITAVVLHIGMPDSETTVLAPNDYVTEHLEGQATGAIDINDDEPTCDIAGGE